MATMTRSDWWLGLLLVTGLVIWHSLVPRYEIRTVSGQGFVLRIDRWTGKVEWATPDRGGTWGKWADLPK
jgi:hypothetical protein